MIINVQSRIIFCPNRFVLFHPRYNRLYFVGSNVPYDRFIKIKYSNDLVVFSELNLTTGKVLEDRRLSISAFCSDKNELKHIQSITKISNKKFPSLYYYLDRTNVVLATSEDNAFLLTSIYPRPDKFRYNYHTISSYGLEPFEKGESIKIDYNYQM